MYTVLLRLIAICLLLSGAASGVEELTIDDDRDVRFLPYSFSRLYGFDYGTARKTVFQSMQVVPPQGSEDDRILLAVAFNPDKNRDNTASLTIYDLARHSRIAQQPLNATITSFTVRRDEKSEIQFIAGCYRSDSAYLVVSWPMQDSTQSVFLGSGVDATGNDAWEPKLVYLHTEDYDYDGRDEVFFYVNALRDLSPRLLVCLQVDPVRLEWTLPVASPVLRPSFFSCRDSLHPGVIFASYGPANGVDDEHFDDRFGYLTRVDANGGIVFSEVVAGGYLQPRLTPLDNEHTRFGLFHNLPLPDDAARTDTATNRPRLTLMDRNGRLVRSREIEGGVQSLSLIHI